ncbi:MAG: cysteine desulfurase-like protein [Planctomycetota bacterium]
MTFTSQHALQYRKQYPGLSRTLDGQEVVFFDGPAGTQVPQCVADAMSHYLLHLNANTHGGFATSDESDRLIEDARQAMADFVGATDRREIVFGQNMTSLTFAFSRALARTWSAGDEIIVTALDHDANIAPWMLAAEDSGVKVHRIRFRDDDFALDMDEFRSRLNDRTQLVAVGCASNASGGVNPVKETCSLAREVGAKTFLDAVHYGPHGLIDVTDWGCDFLCCSTYKFFGPHLGVMWGRAEHLENLTPYKVRPSSDEIPDRWMTGTQSHESIAGALACVDYLADIGRELSGDRDLERRSALVAAFEGIRDYEQQLSLRLIEGLKAIDGITIYGIDDASRLSERFPTISITHRDVPSSRLAAELAQRGIFVWSGNYYALQFTTDLGLEPEGMVRIGLVHYNTDDEIDRLMSAIREIAASGAAVG